MQLSQHLQRFSENKYKNIMIHPELSMQDEYVFISSRLLMELSKISYEHIVEIEIINIDYDDYAIPNFIITTKHGEETNRQSFDAALDDCFDKYHVEFVSAYIKNYFSC